MKQFLNRATNLLSVKSLVTLILTVVFGIKSVKGDIDVTSYMTVFTMVVSFYFGTQYQKAADGGTDGTENSSE